MDRGCRGDQRSSRATPHDLISQLRSIAAAARWSPAGHARFESKNRARSEDGGCLHRTGAGAAAGLSWPQFLGTDGLQLIEEHWPVWTRSALGGRAELGGGRGETAANRLNAVQWPGRQRHRLTSACWSALGLSVLTALPIANAGGFRRPSRTRWPSSMSNNAWPPGPTTAG